MDDKPLFVHCNNYFPKSYVDKLLNIVYQQEFEKAITNNLNTTNKIRKSLNNQFTGPQWNDPDLRMIYLETLQIISWANSFYNFDINIEEHVVQLTKYSEQGSLYGWHNDADFLFREGPPYSQRKLSCTIILKEAEEGGIFETQHGTGDFDQKAGSIFVFPSFYSHQVTPIIKGERISIVTWTCGPEWR